MLKEIMENLMDERLEEMYRADVEYCTLAEEERKAAELIVEKIPEEYQDYIDEYAAACNACAGRCIALAYKKGWADHYELLKDLDRVQRNLDEAGN